MRCIVLLVLSYWRYLPHWYPCDFVPGTNRSPATTEVQTCYIYPQHQPPGARHGQKTSKLGNLLKVPADTVQFACSNQLCDAACPSYPLPPPPPGAKYCSFQKISRWTLSKLDSFRSGLALIVRWALLVISSSIAQVSCPWCDVTARSRLPATAQTTQ